MTDDGSSEGGRSRIVSVVAVATLTWGRRSTMAEDACMLVGRQAGRITILTLRELRLGRLSMLSVTCSRLSQCGTGYWWLARTVVSVCMDGRSIACMAVGWLWLCSWIGCMAVGRCGMSLGIAYLSVMVNAARSCVLACATRHPYVCSR